MQHKQDTGQQRNRQAVRVQDIGEPEHQEQRQAGDVQPLALHQCNRPLHAAFYEKRQYPARHDKDQRHHQVHAGIQPGPLRTGIQAHGTGIEQQVAAHEQHQLGQDADLLPLAHTEDRAGNRDCQCGIERAVGQCRPVQRHLSAGQQQHTCCQPGKHQQQQRRTVQGLYTGPVFYGRQQETGDHGHGVAEHHFVGMPCRRGKLLPPRPVQYVDTRPDQHREHGKQRG